LGCGLTDCADRYDLYDARACAEKCEENPECNAFTWAPTDGDILNLGQTVCTIYKKYAPTATWPGMSSSFHIDYMQVFCKANLVYDMINPILSCKDNERIGDQRSYSRLEARRACSLNVDCTGYYVDHLGNGRLCKTAVLADLVPSQESQGFYMKVPTNHGDEGVPVLDTTGDLRHHVFV
jgi:hypothetical protein